jgi:hypothetical protein
MYYGVYGDKNNIVKVLGACNDTTIGGEEMIDGDHSLPLVRSNFIPMLTNTCTESGQGKDIILASYETKGNFSGDKLIYANGVDETLSVGENNFNFEDLYYSPVMNLMYLWIMYIHYVGKALCNPDWNYVVNRIIDYTCSIYIFMLGTDNSTIIRWTRYTGCYPASIPFGSIQHSQNANSDELRNIQIPFNYNFAIPMDPAVLTEFNMISGPSIFERLVGYYDDSETNPKLTNELIRNNVLSEENAMRLLREYPPIYQEGMLNSNTLPQKRINPISQYDNETHIINGYEDLLNGESYNPLLINRANGLIDNTFSGIPFIVDGNKLMFV